MIVILLCIRQYDDNVGATPSYNALTRRDYVNLRNSILNLLGLIYVVSNFYLCEWQLFTVGATFANTLLDDTHRESTMGDTLGRLARITLV